MLLGGHAACARCPCHDHETQLHGRLHVLRVKPSLTSLCMQSVKWTDDTVEVNEFMGKKSSKSECAGMRSSRPVPLPISASSASF